MKNNSLDNNTGFENVSFDDLNSNLLGFCQDIQPVAKEPVSLPKSSVQYQFALTVNLPAQLDIDQANTRFVHDIIKPVENYLNQHVTAATYIVPTVYQPEFKLQHIHALLAPYSPIDDPAWTCLELHNYLLNFRDTTPLNFTSSICIQAINEAHGGITGAIDYACNQQHTTPEIRIYRPNLLKLLQRH